MLGSCGGGGSGGGGSTGGTPVPASFVPGRFLPESNFAAACAVPRTGADPVTHKAYPDHPGALLDELNWLRSWTNDLYLWFDEVPDRDPAGFSTDAAYFDVLKTTAVTPSGHPKDKFHFTYATSVWESLSQSGTAPGYGATFVVLAASPPRHIVVAYTEPGSRAATAPASLARGAQVLAVDGVDAVNATSQSSIDTLNAGLSPQNVGQTHTFSILDIGATTPREVTLMSAEITATPVQNVHTIATGGNNKLGYLLFNDHLATAEQELIAAFNQLQADGVTDLVLDIRYNGGGYLDIASEVAYMIAGPAQTGGRTFELTQFNSKHAATDPATGAAITPLAFHSTTQGFSTTAGQSLPTLNLPRVFLLTGAGTCSASESIINSLQGVDVQVIQIGSTTCGKPYGFYPADNCGTTYFSIQFKGVNAKGFGDYPDGFTPSNAVTAAGVPLPGCAVADDFAHALGDSAEGLLAAAIGYQTNGVCPAPPTAVTHAPVVIKSVWRRNRIQGLPPALRR
ncbi:MAG: S41 family peptidase [Pseudomonadota bacterium]|nr:S41 family peptidase [Pseudomonadota bacterium]